MTPRATLLALSAALGLGGCAVPLNNPDTPAPSPEAVAACNTRADEQFAQQNRDAAYRADTYQTSERDSPLSGAGLPGDSRGLSDQYERGQDVEHCLNGVATPLSPQRAATPGP
jgi:hypothetical protein